MGRSMGRPFVFHSPIDYTMQSKTMHGTCRQGQRVAPCGTSRAISFGRSVPPAQHPGKQNLSTSFAIPFATKIRSSTTTVSALPGLTFVEGYIEVETIEGMRVQMNGETPRVDYLVKWKVR